MSRCRPCGLDLDGLDVFLEHIVTDHLYRIERMMTDARTDQQHLADDVSQLNDAVGRVEAEIAALKAQPAAAALDFTDLDASVARLSADAPAAPVVPADPAPVDSAPSDPAPVVPAPDPVAAPDGAVTAAPVLADPPAGAPVTPPAS